jgi:hypothetical protein
MRQPFYWIKTITPTGLKKEYARILPDIRQAARKRGYAIGVHGSMMRDLDLIAVPWKTRTSSQKALIKAIQLAVSHCYEKEPTIIKRPHGRTAYILKIGRKAYIDLSVMPANRDKAHNTMGIAPSFNRQAEPLVRWRQCAEEMPTDEVILLTTSKVRVVGDWYKGKWRTALSYWKDGELQSFYQKEDITHWTPLPALPST